MAEKQKSSHIETRNIDPADEDELKEYFLGHFLLSTTRYGPKGYLFPRELEDTRVKIYNMELRPSDTFVVSYPKTGTTMTQELVWLIANNFDYEKALEIPLAIKFPFIEIPCFINSDFFVEMTKDQKIEKAAEEMALFSMEQINNLPSPRFIKSHLPMSLLPPKLLDTCKVVYVTRNPKDVIVSFFHHSKLMKMCPENRDFKTYWKFFINDLIPWTPFFEHIKEAWQLRNHPNILFLFYEDLTKDLPSSARRVASFLGKEISEEQITKLCDHLKIDNFKNNKSVNLENMKGLGILNENESFIRKGKVGGWRAYFDEEMIQKTDQWIEENLRDTDLRFPQ